MENNKYQEYFSNLSLPELLHVATGCQKRYQEGKPCAECPIFKKGNCDGKRDIEQNELLEDLHLEQIEQM